LAETFRVARAGVFAEKVPERGERGADAADASFDVGAEHCVGDPDCWGVRDGEKRGGGRGRLTGEIFHAAEPIYIWDSHH
jgi:hypothetical protein